MLGRAWRGLPLCKSLAAMTNPPLECSMSLIMLPCDNVTLPCDNVTQNGREGAREVQVVATYCTGWDHLSEVEFWHMTKISSDLHRQLQGKWLMRQTQVNRLGILGNGNEGWMGMTNPITLYNSKDSLPKNMSWGTDFHCHLHSFGIKLFGEWLTSSTQT